jgi:hypothetical protein
MGVAGGALEPQQNDHGAPQQWFRYRRAAGPAEKDAEIGEAGRHRGMIRTEAGFIDSQGTAKQRLSFGEALQSI